MGDRMKNSCPVEKRAEHMPEETALSFPFTAV
jgi:hypothetical protein